MAFLTPGVYRVRFEVNGFNNFKAETVSVTIGETTNINATLAVSGIVVDPINVNNAAPLIKTDNPTLGQRAEFFNLFNTVNYANPISKLNFATTDDNTGRVIDAGDFGRIISTSNNRRLIQLTAKFSF